MTEESEERGREKVADTKFLAINIISHNVDVPRGIFSTLSSLQFLLTTLFEFLSW